MKKYKLISALTAAIMTFSLPAGVLAASFADTAGHWGEAYIEKAVEKGLFLGDGNGNFNPDGQVSRAQFITVLWRMAGSPEANEEVPFTDIADQHADFKAAITWAYSKGYIEGTSETTFGPDATLTREATMRILFSYSGAQTGGELMFIPIYDETFKDSDNISDWAKSAVYWGVYNEIITGIGDNVLDPQGVVTRAQLAKIMNGYIEINNNQES